MKVLLAKGEKFGEYEFYPLKEEAEDSLDDFPDDTFEVDPIIFNEYRNAVTRTTYLKNLLTEIARLQGVDHW